MIDHEINLAFDLAPKTHQKSTKDVPKIDEKGIKNMMQLGLVFGPLLARIWVDLAAKLEAKLDPSWHQNLKKRVTEKSSKKHQKKNLQGTHPGFLLAPKKSLRDL